jgi:dTDP-4-dehydrorhamnose reductase
MSVILIFGGQGMLGHKVWQVAHERGHEAWATVRRMDGPLMVPARAIGPVDASDPDAVAAAFDRVHPDAVVNCVGVVKQSRVLNDSVSTLLLNSVLPHRLAARCLADRVRLVHISTDCVFSGSRGNYREADVPDAGDLYGRSKLVGEVGAPAVTLRTSMIGRELTGQHGLVEWFLHQRGPIHGFRRAIFSGLTTRELARVIVDVIESHSALEGLYHVAAAPIDKYTLLQQIAAAAGHRPAIVPVDTPAIDRSLDGSVFLRRTGRAIPSWDHMIAELATEIPEYATWRDS